MAGNGRRLAGCRIHRPRRAKRPEVAFEAQIPGAPAPLGHQFVETGVHLLPAGMEGRLLCRLPGMWQAVLVEVGEDLPAASGEGVEEVLAVAREFEARHRSHHPRRYRKAAGQEPRGKLVAVVGSDQLLVAAQQGGLDASPLAFTIARHVRQHAVGMELGIEIAARQMTEARHRHAVCLHAGTASRLRVPAPGLEKIRLDPVKRRPHRLVVGADHTGITHHQGFQRHRLRRRERDVPAGTVLVLALDDPAQTDVALRHMARQHRFEARRDHMASKAEVARGFTVPEARLAVLRVVLRVVAVLLVVADRGRRGRKFVDRRDHGLRPTSAWHHGRGGEGRVHGTEDARTVEPVHIALEQHHARHQDAMNEHRVREEPDASRQSAEFVSIFLSRWVSSDVTPRSRWSSVVHDNLQFTNPVDPDRCRVGRELSSNLVKPSSAVLDLQLDSAIRLSAWSFCR